MLFMTYILRAPWCAWVWNPRLETCGSTIGIWLHFPPCFCGCTLTYLHF